jgi:membrane fusion protein, multidrug efflux system
MATIRSTSRGSKSRIAAMAAGALLLCACSRGGNQDETHAPAPNVTVVAAVSEEIKPTVTFTGRVQAQDKVELRARIDGFLQKRLFEEGQDVKVGDLLFVIEQDAYKATVAETKANIEKVQAAVTLANIEYDRASRLVQSQAGTQARLDDATAKQAEARGELARLKAALDKAELQLSYTEIRAPVAGRIGRSTYSIGNFVSPQSGPLATIVRQDPINVVFPVTAREMLEVRKEAKEGVDPTIFVQLADGSRYAQPGKVNFIDVTVNPGTDTVLVRALFPNPDRILVDGQLVTVVVEEGAGQSALIIPQRAIQSDQGGAFVLVVDGADKVEVQRVEVDQGPGDRLIVKKGLAAGDKVIVDGVQKVHPGEVVQATEIKAGT